MSDKVLDIVLRQCQGDFELDLSARISGKGVTAIMGPNGAGKSTLLRLIAGLNKPSEGHIRCGDTIWFEAGKTALKAWQRPVGLVFQDGALFDHLSVAGNLAYADRRAPDHGQSIDLDNVIEALDLAALLSQHPQTLSGGERQRVALGRALLTRPDWLLLDEPLAALDRERRAQMLPYLREILDRFAIPALLVSHALDEIAELADDILVLSKGHLLVHDRAETVLARYDVETAEGRQGPSSLVDARIVSHDLDQQITVLDMGGQALDMPLIDDVAVGSPVRLRIRARDVALALERPVGTSIRNILKVGITDIQSDPASPFAHVRLSLGQTELRSQITCASLSDLNLKTGQSVFALIRSVSFER